MDSLIDFNSLQPYQQIGYLTAQNNAWSAQQAQKQMDFQERMSSTAHQREVEDLKAAGLNPVLSARLGGASTPSGAMGSTDTSGASSFIDLLTTAMETANSASKAAASASSVVQDNSAKNISVGKDSNGNPLISGSVPENTGKLFKDLGEFVMNLLAGNAGKAKAAAVNAAKDVAPAFGEFVSAMEKNHASYKAQAASYNYRWDPVVGSWVYDWGG